MLRYSLVQWLKHSRKEYCELCKHRFAFTPSKYSWHWWIIHFNILNRVKFPKQALQMGPYVSFLLLFFSVLLTSFNYWKSSVLLNNIRILSHTKDHLNASHSLFPSVLFSLLPRHALTSAHPGHLCWPADQCGHGHSLLVPLHTGGLRMAWGGSSHSM